MFSSETTDVLALEYAILYGNVSRLLDGSPERQKVLDEIRGLANRTIGGEDFEAAISVLKRNGF